MKTKFIVFFGLILLQSCADRPSGALVLQQEKLVAESKPDTKSDASENKNGNSTELSYQNVLTQVLQSRCLNCHSEIGGNRGKLNLEGYQNIFNNRERIREEVVTKKMPKRSASPLSDDQLQLIINWIDAGTNEFATFATAPVIIPPVDQPSSPPTPSEPDMVFPSQPPAVTPISPVVTPPAEGPIDFENLNFSGVMKLVIEPKCLKCHSANAKNGVELVTYENLRFQKEDIKNDVQSGKMPRKDSLTDSQKKLILDWIAAEMPEK